jgi:serine/threonine-protein kinase HipA
MAQLAEEMAADKDQASMEDLLDLIRKFRSSPKLEHAECFKRILFCFLNGNGDMHLKIWSLMKDLNTGLAKLSPLYDCLNVRAWFPQEQVELILPMAGKTRNFHREDFERFALEAMDLQPIFVSKIFRDLAHWLGIITEFCQRSSLSSGMKQRYMTIVQERYSRLSG